MAPSGDCHSGKAGLGLGLLLGRLATGSDPGVSSPHVLVDISHGAGHGLHPCGDANGIHVQLPPIANPGMGAEGNPPDLVGRLNAVTTPHGQRTATELGKVHGWRRPHLHRSRFPGRPRSGLRNCSQWWARHLDPPGRERQQTRAAGWFRVAGVSWTLVERRHRHAPCQGWQHQLARGDAPGYGPQFRPSALGWFTSPLACIRMAPLSPRPIWSPHQGHTQWPIILAWLRRQPSSPGKALSAQPECFGALAMAHLRPDQPCLVA